MIRRRSRIETELPPEVRDQLNIQLMEGATYEEAAEWCSRQGYEISKSSVGRYGQRFFKAYQEIIQFEDQSKAIMTSSEKGLPMEEALGKMLLKEVMAKLVEGDVDIIENSRLISDIAKLQGSHVKLAKHKMELEAKASKVAKECEEIAKRGGLSDDAANQIRSKILGISA